jgi:heavy metal sensor kinase
MPFWDLDSDYWFERELLRYAREAKFAKQVAALFNGEDGSEFYYAVWSPNGELITGTTNTMAPLVRPTTSRDASMRVRARGNCREAYLYTRWDECILVGKSVANESKALRSFALWILIAGGAILVLGAGVGWWLTVRALKPVEEISAAATRIAAGRLSERIQSPDPENEIGRLASVLNSTFQRLEEAFARQREFTANASHELRTPLAVIISEAQTTLSRDRSANEYKEAIGVCLDAARQMSHLTASLLELARFDANPELQHTTRFDLAEKTRDVVDMLEPLAAERQITIEVVAAPVEITANPDRIGQVLVNLLSNAIYYNKDQGKIRVSVAKRDGAALLEVADTGCGIPPESLPRVFERFYRVDKARARSHGHSGLGLAIVKEIVEAHGGAITMASELGVGSTCSVRLPIAANLIPA